MKRKSKLIAAAIALLGFSTAASVTGTVAWFTANNTVTAEGMSIKAEAEEGIVIAAEKDGTKTSADWAVSATALHTYTSGAGFIPTSTSDASAWYHANAANVDSHVHTGDYATLSVTAPTLNTGDGVGKATVNDIANRNIYLLNHFYIQSVTPTALTEQDLFINSVSAEDTSGLALNKSVRILFKLGSTVKIYAPLADDNFAAVEHAGAANKAASGAAADKILDNSSIPAYVAAGTGALDLLVYIYFEGEDSNCKSSNITTLSTVSVSFQVKNLPHQA